jgi:hypothetical protein
VLACSPDATRGPLKRREPESQRCKSCESKRWVFGWDIAHEAVSRRPPISLDTSVDLPHMYTHDAKVWYLPIVQGPFSVAPFQTLPLRFATLATLYEGGSERTMASASSCSSSAAAAAASRALRAALLSRGGWCTASGGGGGGGGGVEEEGGADSGDSDRRGDSGGGGGGDDGGGASNTPQSLSSSSSSMRPSCSCRDGGGEIRVRKSKRVY